MNLDTPGLRGDRVGPALRRPRPGVPGTGHIPDVADVLHHDRHALRIHDGGFSAMDLTARHPRTGELLSTVKFVVHNLAAGELQCELTYGGLRAAEAKSGRRPAIPAAKPRPGACESFS